MLIQSPRHTAADLDLWSELETADRVHGAGPLIVERELAAARVLSAFAADGPCYAGISGGKDSAVVAHIIHNAGLRIPLVRIKILPIVNPDCDEAVSRLLSTLPGMEYHEIEVWCWLDRHGWHATGTLERGFVEAEKRFGKRHISGVRAEESGVRKIAMRRWGHCSEHACRPIGWWEVQDVYGYLAKYDLPIHPAYAMLGGGRWPRHRLRVDHLGLTAANQFGRSEWEQEYYGDVLNRLAAQST